jgi:hypothetical protein
VEKRLTDASPFSSKFNEIAFPADFPVKIPIRDDVRRGRYLFRPYF